MTRDKLILLIDRILKLSVSTDSDVEEELSVALDLFERSVSYSGVSDLIFWDDSMPEEIVDKALLASPIIMPPPLENHSDDS